jgi:hypothetical protein
VSLANPDPPDGVSEEIQVGSIAAGNPPVLSCKNSFLGKVISISEDYSVSP